MKYDCELIQDLIPLVKDGIASKASSSAVEQHIKECFVCKDAYEIETQIILPYLDKNDSLEISKVMDYKTRIKMRKKIVISLVALITVILIIVTIIITTQIVTKFLEGDTYSTRNIADYGNYNGHIEAEQEGFFSLLEIFPNEVPLSTEVKDFYYFCNNGMLDNSYQLYLLCSYDEKNYIFEKERLESIEFTFRNEVQKPVITDTGFNYHAVVTIFDAQNSFEYALIEDDTNTIAYVFVQSMEISKSVVPLQYQPKGFKPPADALTEWGGYNIYRFKLDDGLFGSTYVIPEKDNINE